MSGKRSISRRTLLRAALSGVAGSAGLMAYADRSAQAIALERHTLALPGWDASGFRVAVLSDIHVSSAQAVERARRAARMALEERPDLIVMVGDFVHSSQRYALEFIGQALEPLRAARCPCLGVMGNHDYWTPQPRKVIEAVSRSPVRLLRNEIVEVAGVSVAGLDDALVNRCRPDVLDASGLSKSVLALLHEPDYVDTMPSSVGLQISGHSHGGQLCLPFGIAVHTPRGARNYKRGFYPKAKVPLYVTRGVGTIGPDLRTFCSPEVSVLTLVGEA